MTGYYVIEGLQCGGQRCHAVPKNEWDVIEGLFEVVGMMMRLFRGIHKRYDISKCNSLIGVPSLKSCELSINE